MKNVLFLDFETRSAIDLKKCGAEVYAKNPTTDILCVGYAFNDYATAVVEPPFNDPDFAQAMHHHVWDGDIVVAHNAPFEYLIWNYVGVSKYGWPKLHLEQLTCTMAMAYAMALPGSLAMAAPALGISDGKDMSGHRVMMQLSQPRKRIDGGCFACGGDGQYSEIGMGLVMCEVCGGTGQAITWWTEEEVPEKFEKLYTYCMKDVEVERDLYKRLMPLSEKEKKIWALDQVINQRGIGVDIEAVKTAIKMVGLEKKRLDQLMREVTGGAVCSCSAVAQLTSWIRNQGVNLPGVAKNHILDALHEKAVGRLSPAIKKALELRQEAAKASTAKLQKMLEGALLEDDSYRIKGCFQYHGASTGRAASRRVNFQNLPRGHLSVDQITHVFDLLHSVDSDDFRSANKSGILR